MPSQPSSPEQPTSRPSPLTLAVASASSVAAAVVVSKLWGPGTVIGAAATPVIITLVGELLKKPAERITVIRVSPAGTQVQERIAPSPSSSDPGMGERSVHRSRRRPLALALATGLVAFVIGAVVLTSSELVLGDASVASGAKRTTVFGGGTEPRSPTREEPAPTTSTETQSETETTTVPTPVAPTQTTPAPTQTETPPPAEPVPPAPAGPPPASESGPTAP